MGIGHSLLAKIVEEGRIAEFLKLREEHFIQDERDCFEAIRKHYDKYGVLPSRKVSDQRLGLKGTSCEDPFGYYHDEIVSRLLFNRFDSVLKEVNEKLKKRESLDALLIVQRFVESSQNLRAEGQRDLVDMRLLGQAVLDEALRARTMSGVTGIVTGWPTMDEITCGLQPGSVYICLARPKMGKSVTMLYMGSAAHLAGHIPLFVSMEMTQEQMARRFLAMRAGFNMDALRSGQISIFGERHLRGSIADLEQQHPFHFVDGQFRKDITDIASLVHSLSPHVLYIDGGYLIKIARMGHRAAKWEIVGEIAQEIKNIASKNRIPTVVSFQFNRQLLSRRRNAEGQPRGGFENIQLADEIGQLASAGWGLFDALDDNGGVSEDARYIEFVGGREGEKGGFTINYDWSRMNFTERPDQYIPYNVDPETMVLEG